MSKYLNLVSQSSQNLVLQCQFLRNFWWIWFMFAMEIYGPKYLRYHPHPSHVLKVKVTDFKFLCLSFVLKVLQCQFLQSLWWIWFIFGMVIKTCPQFFAVPYPYSRIWLNFYVNFLQGQFLQRFWWILFMFGINRHTILICFRKEKGDFRRAVLSGDRSY